MDKTDTNYDEALVAFVQRHESAKRWIRGWLRLLLLLLQVFIVVFLFLAHHFYLCELEISNVFVLDYYGGPHTVSTEEYYAVKL